ncbi:MAG: hypothetical protein ABI358_05225 [Ginsengibacter sp.]
MMNYFKLVRVVLLILFFLNSFKVFPQKFVSDSSGQSPAMQVAVSFYHQFLSPETGLYNGSEYTYNTYYPFTINEGNPFFFSKGFEPGSVFYNNVLYENVPLLYDIIKDELLINDPSRAFIIRLNNSRIAWFKLWGHTFVWMMNNRTDNSSLSTGFYLLLHNGKTSLYARDTKSFKENTASIQGLNKYVVESIDYFIEKDSHFYKIKNRKSLLSVLSNKKKEVTQFIKKNRLNLRKDKVNALTKAVAYYDEINQ